MSPSLIVKHVPAHIPWPLTAHEAASWAWAGSLPSPGRPARLRGDYLLVCGEGRLNAFRILGETHIPALVVDVTDEDAFIMSLAENIARRG